MRSPFPDYDYFDSILLVYKEISDKFSEELLKVMLEEHLKRFLEPRSAGRFSVLRFPFRRSEKTTRGIVTLEKIVSATFKTLQETNTGAIFLASIVPIKFS